MAYTPINWQTGDTITAEKLNRCDNGWSVSTSELFSETVTTVYNDESGMSMGVLECTDALNANVIVFEFEGTTYSVPGVQADAHTYMYGEFTESGPDFSTFPFLVSSELLDGAYENIVVTENPGSYDISAFDASSTVEVSQGFAAAVNAVAPLPMLCTENETTMGEMDAAKSEKMLMYVYAHGSYYIINAYVAEAGNQNAVTVVPEMVEGMSVGFDNDGVLQIYTT